MARRYPKDPATEYARGVRAGTIVAGPHVRAACERHLRDYQRAKAKGLYWDVEAVEWVIEYFRKVLRLAGGEHEGLPFNPTPWQCFVLGSIFGWKLVADGTRRFRVAFILTGKGSGKTPLAAGIGHFMATADRESRAEVYAAAVDKDQASVLFRDAVAMAQQSNALAKRVTFSGGKGREFNMAYLESGSFFRPISSESSGRGKSGYRPHCVLLDEIHEHPTNAMVEFLRAGTKGRRQALIFMITNAGVDRNSVCFEYHTYGAKVAAGDIEDESFFSYICALDEGEDPFEDESCWPKANPSQGVTFLPRYLEEQVAQARGMPGKEALVRRLNFCEWTDATSPWVDGDLWRACERPELDLDAFIDRPCYLGLDLGSKRDLCALSAVWPDEDGAFDAAIWAWTPSDTLIERERKDQAPYGVWVDRGFLTAVPGRIVDFVYVAEQVAELTRLFNIIGLAFDTWRIDDFQRALDTIGLENFIFEGEEESEDEVGLLMMRHGQGTGGGATKEKTLWMPDSINRLEEAVMRGKLRVRANPALTWASASAVLHSDPAGNRKWEKRKSTGKIDPLVALSMGVGLADRAPMPEPEYDGPLITMLG